MRKEVIDYFEANKTPIAKMILVGIHRKGLDAAAITAAAEQLYDEINEGRQVFPIRAAWEVFSRAKVLKGSAAKEEYDKIGELRKKIEWYEQPWWKTIFRRPK